MWSVIPVLLRPRSKGVIKLRSKNPFDYPLIYPNYFLDPQDIKVLVEGVKIGIAISNTKSFRRYVNYRESGVADGIVMFGYLPRTDLCANETEFSS